MSERTNVDIAEETGVKPESVMLLTKSMGINCRDEAVLVSLNCEASYFAPESKSASLNHFTFGTLSNVLKNVFAGNVTEEQLESIKFHVIAELDENMVHPDLMKVLHAQEHKPIVDANNVPQPPHVFVTDKANTTEE